MERVSSPLRRHVLVVAVYLILALILTYPLALRPHTHVPGDGIDDPALVWNLWWIKSALVDRQVNPFDCDWMFYPIGINLAFYTLTILNGLLSVPLQGVMGLISSSNVVLASSFVLGSYGTFLLAEHVRSDLIGDRDRGSDQLQYGRQAWQSILPSVLAGAVYGFSSSKLFYASLGQFNIASSQWIPFAALYMLRLGRGRNCRDAMLAALFLILQAYAELTFASFLVLLLGLWVLYRLVGLSLEALKERRDSTRTRDDWSSVWRLVRDVAIVGAVFALAIAPFLVNMLPDLLSQGDLLTRGGGFEDVFSADLLGYFVPTTHHPLIGDAVAMLPFEKDKGQHIFLGYAVMVLSVLGAWRSRRSGVLRFWSVAALAFFALTLGPTLRIAGLDTGIRGPFLLVSRLPLFEGNRYPSRYSVMLVLSCAMLASVGSRYLAGWIERRLARTGGIVGRGRKRWVALVMSGLMLIILLEHLSVPLPLTDLRTPSEYEGIDAEDGDLTVLDLPLGWRNGARVLGQQDEKIMFVQWYQTSHGQRILGGNTSRNPEFKFQYFAGAPVISSIIALENGRSLPQEVIDQDSHVAAEVLGFLGVRYVSVHEPPVSQELLEYVEAVLPLHDVVRGPTMRLYEVAAHSAVDTVIAPGSELGRLRLGEGWSPVEDTLDDRGVVWAQQETVRILPRLSGEEVALELQVWSPAADQVISLTINGQDGESATLDSGWNQVQIGLPQRAIAVGLNDLHLRFGTMYDQAGVAASANLEACDIPKSANIWSMVVQSAGMDSGGSDLGHVHVNGVDLSPNQRGYNIVALGSQGDLLHQASYDTHLDPSASHRLAQAIGELPRGTLVGIAAADEAAMNLTEELVQALRTLGATGDLRGSFRAGHAIIGSVGAPEGSALEETGDLKPLEIHCGLGVTKPTVALAVSGMRFVSLD